MQYRVDVSMFIFNRHTLKISIGCIKVQEFFCIGVSQKGWFKEKEYVAKTPLGRKVMERNYNCHRLSR